MAREASRYDNAGTVEFLYDLDRHEWFFIEMNPRIQVEHTVTEVVTGIDLVRSQILIAQGHPLHSTQESPSAPQDEDAAQRLRHPVPVTTEDPSNGFSPDYGRMLATTARPADSASGSTRHGRFRGGHHAVLRLDAGEGHRDGPRASRSRLPAWTAPSRSSASAG